MIFSLDDAEKNKKNLTNKEKKKWAYIASSAYEALTSEGIPHQKAYERAIKIASSKFQDEPFNGVLKRASGIDTRQFQNRRKTPQDPIDGHVHTAAYDDEGNGGTDIAGNPPHAHQIYGFKTQPTYAWDPATSQGYTSNHPGTLAYGDTQDISEMEIFRAGTHNGDEYTEEDLEEIARNFNALKNDIRPKLKITHLDDDDQEDLAGLASYGDVVAVYTKPGKDGKKHLYARLNRVPKEVADWIREGRFAERSIEIYPEFQLGTEEEPEVYRNVLKSIALLGHQMPAVTGMEPIRLEECMECQGTACYRENMKAETVTEKTEEPSELEANLFSEKLKSESIFQTEKEVI